MKLNTETHNSEKKINRRKYSDEMPHISSQEGGEPNEMEGYEEYLNHHGNQQNPPPPEGSEQNHLPFNYIFFDDSALTNVYVNSKQLVCIKKRKMRRDYLDTLMVPPRNSYLHESRHRHAMKRLRAPSGRFLTKEETEEFYKNQGPEQQREDL